MRKFDRLLIKLNKYDLGGDTGGGASRSEKNDTSRDKNESNKYDYASDYNYNPAQTSKAKADAEAQLAAYQKYVADAAAKAKSAEQARVQAEAEAKAQAEERARTQTAGQEKSVSTPQNLIEQDLTDYFSGIEQKEDLIKEGAFAEENNSPVGILKYVVPGISPGPGTPTFDDFVNKEAELKERFPDIIGGLQGKELAALSYLSQMSNNQASGLLAKAAVGATNPINSSLGTAFGIGKMLFGANDTIEAVASTFNLTEKEAENVEKVWSEIRAASLQTPTREKSGNDNPEYIANEQPESQQEQQTSGLNTNKDNYGLLSSPTISNDVNSFIRNRRNKYV